MDTAEVINYIMEQIDREESMLETIKISGGGDVVLATARGKLEAYYGMVHFFNAENVDKKKIDTNTGIPVDKRKKCTVCSDVATPRCMSYDSKTQLCSGIMRCNNNPYLKLHQ